MLQTSNDTYLVNNVVAHNHAVNDAGGVAYNDTNQGGVVNNVIAFNQLAVFNAFVVAGQAAVKTGFFVMFVMHERNSRTLQLQESRIFDFRDVFLTESRKNKEQHGSQSHQDHGPEGPSIRSAAARRSSP